MPRRPNIILVLLDDLGKEWISAYGAQDIHTPHIDALAAAGTRFDNVYSMPQCTPSRVCLLTGQYPYRNGWVNHWDVPRWGAGARFDVDRYPCTLGVMLRDAGYATAAAGKWQINDFRLEPDAMTAAGFAGYCMWTGFEAGNPPSAERYWDPYVYYRGQRPRTVTGAFGPDLFCDFVIDFVRAQAASATPFFVYYPMVLTHTPFTTTPLEPTAATDRDKHKAMVRHSDHLLGRLVGALEDTGAWDHTILLFTSDNGTCQQMVGQLGARRVRGGKSKTVEPGVNIPFIAACPGRIPAGRVSTALLDFTDIVPTCAELAGLPVPGREAVDGCSVAACLTDDGARSPRHWILAMGGRNEAEVSDRGVENRAYFRDRVVRDERYKLYIGQDRRAAKLVDLAQDPDERVDLSGAETGAALLARRQLEGLIPLFPARDADPPYTPAPAQAWDRPARVASVLWKDGCPAALRQARWERHRNLFSGDFGVFFWRRSWWQEGTTGPYPAAAIGRLVGALAASGVDTFVLNPSTQVAWYPSRAVPTVLDGYQRGAAGHLEPFGELLEPLLDLREAGVDLARATTAACRDHGISPWVSVRMNDMHWAATPDSPANCPLFRDPACRLSGRGPAPGVPPDPYRAALDYAHPAVRDYMGRMIRELVQDYDFEGLELDWLRNPNCCEPVAAPATVETMTAWLAELRHVTLAQARRTGRPFAFGLRLPGELDLLRQIGLDVRRLAAERLIDYLVVSNFMQTSWDMPHDALRAEFGEHVVIFGCSELQLSGVPGWAPGAAAPASRLVSGHGAAVRGNAAGKLVLGADGMEHYNYYWCRSLDDFGHLAGAGDLALLRGTEKQYAVGSRAARVRYPPFDRVEPLPVELLPGERRQFRLPMCAEPAAAGLELVVHITIPADATAAIGVSVNGSWPRFDGVASDQLLFTNGPLTRVAPGYRALVHRLPADLVRDGWNEVTLHHPGDPAPAVRIVALELGMQRPA